MRGFVVGSCCVEFAENANEKMRTWRSNKLGDTLAQKIGRVLPIFVRNRQDWSKLMRPIADVVINLADIIKRTGTGGTVLATYFNVMT